MRTNLSIDGERLWTSIAESAKIGTGPRGGLRRLTLTEDDKAMRDLFASWAVAAGYGVIVDQLGSMFARREGSQPKLPPVLIGSHLDTQAAGGRFDGILGVLGGLEVLRTLDDLGLKTKRAIEVVNWTNEEGARFYPPMMCSLVFSGRATVGWAHDRQDKDGRDFGHELKRIGYAGTAPVGGRAVDAYFELHIEQGPKLDASGVKVGVVTGGFPTCGMRIEIIGETAHVGPTAMALRRNALVAASHVAVAIDDIGWRYAHAEGKTTAARLDLWPNLPGIISERATLFCDLRHPDPAQLNQMVADIETALPDCARRGQCGVAIAERWGFGVMAFDAELIALIREAAAELGHPTMDVKSEAGHDSYNLATMCPSAMIFTPCKGGISHNEAEDTTLEDTLPGANVLLRAVIARANR